MRLYLIRESRKNFLVPITVFLLCMLMLSPFPASAQEKTVTWYADPSAVPPDLPVALKHLSAQLRFEPEKNLVQGTAEFTVIPNRSVVDSIVFYAPDFQVAGVKIDDRELPFHQNGASLVLETGAHFTPQAPMALKEVNDRFRPSVIKITYTATPLSGHIYFIGWKPEEAGKRKEIWAHRPHGWLPYLDARITTDLWITFEKKYAVFSNGERLDVRENNDSTLTWHYVMKKDHPYFSTALVIGDYRYATSKTTRGTPLEYWYYPDMADRVGTTYKYTEAMFDFFEEAFGAAYPYPVYREAPVIDYMYGAMETTTSTVFGDYMLIGPRSWWQRNYVNVNAHELAHQWFGNCIGHFVNRDVWLTESFATYYAKMFEKYIYGEDYYQNVRNDELIQTLEAAGKNSYPVGGSQGGVARIYQKGSLVLDMLRDVMGDSDFKAAIKHYFEKYRFNYAETNDFIRCVYEATGKPYNWFFDEWVLRGGEPEYRIAWSVQEDTIGNRSTRVQVWQVHKTNELTGLFKMPISFQVYYKDGTFDSARVWVENKYNEVVVPNNLKKTVAFVLFDPNRHVVKKVEFPRKFPELAAQFSMAENMIDRYDALIAMRDTSFAKKQALLIDGFHRETFHLIKSEILAQLSSDNTPETIELFREALLDSDANVRKAALKNLSVVPVYLQGTVEAMLQDSSYLNVELALGILCSSFPNQRAYYLGLTENEEGWRGRNIRMKWLEIALTAEMEEKIQKAALAELVSYTGPKYEFETRINAFNLLKRLQYADAETLSQARAASKHWNNKLSSAAKHYLTE